MNEAQHHIIKHLREAAGLRSMPAVAIGASRIQVMAYDDEWEHVTHLLNRAAEADEIQAELDAADKQVADLNAQIEALTADLRFSEALVIDLEDEVSYLKDVMPS